MEGALAWEETWLLCPALPVACNETLVGFLCVSGPLFLICKTGSLGKWSLRSLPAVILNNRKLLKKYKQEMKVLPTREEEGTPSKKNRGSHKD